MNTPRAHDQASCTHPDCQFEAEFGYNPADPLSRINDDEITSNGIPLTERPKMTWRCDKCGAEWDQLTYGGPCPGRDLEGCHGELQRRKVTS